MKIYTKTGDAGETGLFAGSRVAKDHPRIEAYGTVDELNAALGLARSCEPPDEMDRVLAVIQNRLFDLGAELATPDAADRGTATINQAHISELETAIDQFDAKIAELKQFILPAGSSLACHLHSARTICRRAERRLVTLMQAPDERVSATLLIYLNRLGDLLFVLARAANTETGLGDVLWEPAGQ